jgi:hypothetical protein
VSIGGAVLLADIIAVIICYFRSAKSEIVDSAPLPKPKNWSITYDTDPQFVIDLEKLSAYQAEFENFLQELPEGTQWKDVTLTMWLTYYLSKVPGSTAENDKERIDKFTFEFIREIRSKENKCKKLSEISHNPADIEGGFFEIFSPEMHIITDIEMFYVATPFIRRLTNICIAVALQSINVGCNNCLEIYLVSSDSTLSPLRPLSLHHAVFAINTENLDPNIPSKTTYTNQIGEGIFKMGFQVRDHDAIIAIGIPPVIPEKHKNVAENSD